MKRESTKSSRFPIASIAGVFLAAFLIGGFFVYAQSRDENENDAKYVLEIGPESTAPTGASDSSGATKDTAAANGPKAILDSSGEASFASLESGMSGEIGIAAAPLGGGDSLSLGELSSARAWSTMKVPVLVTLMRQLERDGESLTSSDKANAAAALERSDNDAAKALFQRLIDSNGSLVAASAEIEKTLRAAGDSRTHVNTVASSQGFTTFGQTKWSNAASVKFFRALANQCLIGKPGTKYVLGLMQNVASDQRWGFGSAGYDSNERLAFKGGWGPESSGRYVVRQDAVIGQGDEAVVIAITAKPQSSGSASFGDGTQMLNQLADWAQKNIKAKGSRPAPNCD